VPRMISIENSIGKDKERLRRRRRRMFTNENGQGKIKRDQERKKVREERAAYVHQCIAPNALHPEGSHRRNNEAFVDFY